MIPALLYSITAILYAIKIHGNQSSILRPSIWVGIIFLIFVCPAAAFLPDTWTYEDNPVSIGDYPELYTLRLTTLAFPLALLAASYIKTPSSTAAAYINARIKTTETRSEISPSLKTILLFASAASALSVYLLFTSVPWQSTGLYAILFTPELSDIAREESLTNLSSPLTQYAYSFHGSVFAPLVTIIAFHWARRRLSRIILFSTVVLPILTASVILPGHRSGIATLLAGMGISILITDGLRRGLIICAFLGLSIMLFFSLSSLMRVGGNDLELSSITAHAADKATIRMFCGPFYTGVLTSDYINNHGNTGITTIRPLAIIFNQNYTPLPPVVGQYYFGGIASMNTSFLFDFQASFGTVVGLLVSITLVCLLDFVIIPIVALPKDLQICLLALLMSTLFSLFSSAFLVCLVTHGILSVPIIGIIASQFSRRTHPTPSNNA